MKILLTILCSLFLTGCQTFLVYFVTPKPPANLEGSTVPYHKH